MWMSYAPSVTHVVASPGIRNSKQHLRRFSPFRSPLPLVIPWAPDTPPDPLCASLV